MGGGRFARKKTDLFVNLKMDFDGIRISKKETVGLERRGESNGFLSPRSPRNTWVAGEARFRDLDSRGGGVR